jgi:hypothetical protein
MSVTTRSYCAYSSSVSTFSSVSFVALIAEDMDPERSTTMTLCATDFLFLLDVSRGSSAGSTR